MKQHRFFNVRLYVDLLRQLMLTGCILATVCCLITLLPPLVCAVTMEDPGRAQVTLASVTPVLWAFMYLGGAGLVYNVFSYLNRRNACDFYYSLPNTACATFLSGFAAAATWIVGTVLATGFCGYLGYTLAGISIRMVMLPYLFGYFAIGTLLVACATAVAVCLSGTRFSNIILTALILFLPRFVMTIVGAGILSQATLVPKGELPFWLNPIYNIAAVPITLFYGLFESGEMPELIAFSGAYLYSAVLALLYFAAALALYIRRRAETAESSAPCRMLQHIYRSAIALPFLTLLAFGAVSQRENVFHYVSSNFSIAVILVLAAALGYFVYELITTKRFKNLLTTLPLFLVLLFAVPVLLRAGMTKMADIMQHRTVAAEDIHAVRIDMDGQFGFRYKSRYKSYETLMTREIWYEDSELCQIVKTALDRTIDQADAIPEVYGRMYDENVWYTVTISSGFGSFRRQIGFQPSEAQRIREIMEQAPAYVAARRTLPSVNEVSNVQLAYASIGYSMDSKIWQAYLDEVGVYGGADYDAAISEDPYQDLLYISVTGTRGLVHFYSKYPLNSYTPKLFERVVSTQNKQLSAVRMAAEALNCADNETGYVEFHVIANFVNAEWTGDEAAEQLRFHYSNSSGKSEPDDRANIQMLLNRAAQQTEDTEIDPADPVLVLDLHYYGEEKSVDATVFIRLNPGEAEVILDQLKETYYQRDILIQAAASRKRSAGGCFARCGFLGRMGWIEWNGKDGLEGIGWIGTLRWRDMLNQTDCSFSWKL